MPDTETTAAETSPTVPPLPEVSEPDVIFGAAMKLLPPYKEIPDEFGQFGNPFHDAVSSLFFNGGRLADFGLTPKPGVEMTKLMRVVKACLRDWTPKHEHKTAGTAFLLSQWCDHAPVKKGAA